MSKMWTIFKHEYTRHVLRKRFLFALLSVPLWIVAMVAIGVLAALLGTDRTPLGYVDHSGLLQNPIMPEIEQGNPFEEVEIRPYRSEEEARAALEGKEIQGYYVLPEDYLQTRAARLFYLEEPDGSAKNDFEDFLQINLLANQPDHVAELVSNGPQLVIIATQEQREMENGDWFKIAAPIVAGIFLITAVFSSGGYLMQAVVEEKENRTMEILATSVSPMQIMAGKIIALICVGLTQVIAWSIFPLVGVAFAVANLPFFRASIDWGMIGLIALLVIPTFILISSLMAAIGATVTQASEGQQVTGLISLPVMSPLMFMGLLISNPGSPIALFLSFFPLTGALTILLRMAFATVPPWQVYASAAILLISSIGGLWLAGRVFRLGMLRYGQRLAWKDIMASFKRNRVASAAPTARSAQ